jgi:hypothetical protein
MKGLKNMKVYVVLQITDYSEYEFCGVYPTEKNAQERIDEIVYEFGVNQERLYIQENELA